MSAGAHAATTPTNDANGVRGAQAGERALTGGNRRHIVADYTSATNGPAHTARPPKVLALGGGVKKTALIAGIVLAGAVAALVLALRAFGKADAPGFFGRGTLLADINITLELLLVTGLTFGMMLARRAAISRRTASTRPRGCWSMQSWSR